MKIKDADKTVQAEQCLDHMQESQVSGVKALRFSADDTTCSRLRNKKYTNCRKSLFYLPTQTAAATTYVVNPSSQGIQLISLYPL